jgi:antitoxin MazE
MESSVQKWGNSLAVRIPRPFASHLGIEDGTAVDMAVEDGGLVIRPLRRGRLSLDDLLGAVDESNLHGETDTGPAVGGESW